MDLPKEKGYVCFKSTRSRETFIYLYVGEKLYHSRDGVKFFELYCTSGGTRTERTTYFEDPHHHLEGKLERNRARMTWGWKVFKLIETPTQIEVVPLPKIRIPKYLYRLNDDEYFYVSGDKYDSSYELYKLFIGPPFGMKPVKIDDIVEMRDATRYIHTVYGILVASNNRFITPNWKGGLLETLDPNDFLIDEKDYSVVLMKR